MAQAVEEPEELAKFREEWKAEVRRNREAQQRLQTEQGHNASQDPAQATHPDGHVVHPSGARKPPGNTQPVRLGTRETSVDLDALPLSLIKALDIYRRAIACEQRSEIDEALQLYRMAFRLNDAVGKIYESIEYSTMFVNDAPPKLVAPHAVSHVKRASVDGAEQLVHAVEGMAVSTAPKHPAAKVTISGTLAGIIASWPTDLSFEPEEEKEPVHLRILPPEILVKILSYLNTTAIERFATVNRRARVLSLDSSLWR